MQGLIGGLRQMILLDRLQFSRSAYSRHDILSQLVTTAAGLG